MPRFSFLKGLAFCGALCFFAPPPLLAANKVRTDALHEIRNKAFEALISRDRQQAIKIVLNAVKSEPPNAQSLSELKKLLWDVSTRFISDRGQQNYELALALRRTDLNEATVKLNEALKLEDGNLILVLEQARVQIAKDDCSAPIDTLEKIKKENPYHEELMLVLASAYLCKANLPRFAAVKTFVDLAKSKFQSQWLYMDIERLVLEKDSARAQEILNLYSKQEPENPELIYWSARIENMTKKKPSKPAELYKAKCSELSTTLFRKYLLDPKLCRRTQELESI